MYKDPTGHDTYYDKFGKQVNKTDKGDDAYMFMKNNSSAPTKMKDIEAVKKKGEENLQKAKDSKEKAAANKEYKIGDVSPSGKGIIVDKVKYTPGGKYPNDNPGTVYIIDTKEKPKPEFWSQFKGNTAEHWTTSGSENMVDVADAKRNGQSSWYGPASDFKVNGAAGNVAGFGGAMFLGLKDGTTVTQGHFTEINKEVIDAAKDGKTLPAGTYLGETRGTIGSSTGPHMHGQAKNVVPITRESMVDKMSNKNL